jgi:hypothetical protein
MLASLLLLLPIAVSGERIRIADLSMSALNEGRTTYTKVSSIVSRFDLVAAEGIGDAKGMEKVLAGMDEGWEASVSRRGFFGFIYNDRVELVKDLGTYPEAGRLDRLPYGAQFRLSGTRFAFNVVACHIAMTGEGKARAAEISRLAAVYRHFEELTGNRGITILLAEEGWMSTSAALRPHIEKRGIESWILKSGK